MDPTQPCDQDQDQAKEQSQGQIPIANARCDSCNCPINHQIQQLNPASRYRGTRSNQRISPVILHNHRLTAKELRQQRLRIVMRIYKILMDRPIQTSYFQAPRHHNNLSYRLFRCAIKIEFKLFEGADSVNAHLNMQTLPQRVQCLYTSLLAHRVAVESVSA